MNYNLETFVWELTMACNLRCNHCGSSCKGKLPGELTTEEALKFIRDVAELKPTWMTLSGGEPLHRKDWHIIAKELTACGISVHMVTNGTLIDENVIQQMLESGVRVVSVSTNGTKELHDAVRGEGCYEKCERAFSLLHKAGITTSTNLTIVKENIDCLPELMDALVKMGVTRCQIQPGLPVGNLASHRESVIDTEDLERLIDFSLEENKKGDISVLLAESIGYYTRNEAISRQMALSCSKLPLWQGCNAGIRSFDLLHNGDVVGCISMRDASFITGNVKNRSIVDIWNDEKSFAWRRNLKACSLKGFCRECKYAETCLGGCTNARLTINQTNDIFVENPFCVYYAHEKNKSLN